jgi:capsular exopolysaccharide synthesis family protein
MEIRRLEAREHVVALRNRLSELDAAVASLQTQVDSLEGIEPGRLPLTAEQELIIEADPILRYLRSQVENLDVEIAARSKLVGPNHREVVMLRQRRQGFFDKEVAKREELMAQVRARQREMLELELAQTRQMYLRLQEQHAEVQSEERDLDRNLLLYQEMVKDEERLGEQIAGVQQRLTEAQHAQRDRSRARLHVRQRPEKAIEPSRPDLWLYLGGGFILALAGGIGFGFLRELTDRAVRTPVDMARVCHLSVLGCIPLLDDEEADVDRIEDAVRLAPHSLVAEAFRRTRTNLQFSGPVESRRTLLVTSPGPGDGKTAVAINLATTMAHGNLRVLLVDCNFRRPAIRSAYADTRPEGLSNLLVGQGKLEDLVTKTDLPTLDVLSSGPMPPTPAELLGSAPMRELIKQAAERYDHVILDGPPTLLISDATVLAMQVDGVVLVGRAEENTRGEVQRAREQLESIKARIVGAILNGVKAKAGGYFKQQYREFYDYTSEETIPAELPEPSPGSGWDSQDDA